MHCALGSDTALNRLKNMWIIYWGVGLIKVRFIFPHLSVDRQTPISGQNLYKLPPVQHKCHGSKITGTTIVSYEAAATMCTDLSTV